MREDPRVLALVEHMARGPLPDWDPPPALLVLNKVRPGPTCCRQPAPRARRVAQPSWVLTLAREQRRGACDSAKRIARAPSAALRARSAGSCLLQNAALPSKVLNAPPREEPACAGERTAHGADEPAAAPGRRDPAGFGRARRWTCCRARPASACRRWPQSWARRPPLSACSMCPPRGAPAWPSCAPTCWPGAPQPCPYTLPYTRPAGQARNGGALGLAPPT